MSRTHLTPGATTPPRTSIRQTSSPLAASAISGATSPNNIRSFSDAALAVSASARNKRGSLHGPSAGMSVTGTATPTGSSFPGAIATSAPATPPPHISDGIPHTPQGSGRSRAKDLLRKHYGLGVGPPPPLQGNVKATDPMNLDSAAFDAKVYYEQLITTTSLPALLKRGNELLTEIRQLDSERQSLVYNHHHELIAASDTIGAMKDRAEKLDADMDLLKAAFSEISRLSAELAVETRRDPGHESLR